MHDDYGSAPAPQARRGDPLRGAPVPGRWSLWHGPQAEALLELAKARGTQVAQPPAPLPEGFPPFMEAVGMWLVEANERRYFVRGEVQNGYVSCYLCCLPG